VFGDNPFFDDEDDALDASVDVGREAKMRRFMASFERSQVVESFFTEKDEELKRMDTPERFGEILVGRSPPGEVEREQEALWISAKLIKRIIQDKRVRAPRYACLK